MSRAVQLQETKLWPRNIFEVFAPLLEPLLYTTGIMLALVLAVAVFSPSAQRGRRMNLAIPICLVLFIPCCGGVMSIVNKDLFGRFRYSTHSQIAYWRAQPEIPSQALDIDLESKQTGFRASYKVEREELVTFLKQSWKETRNSSPNRSFSEAMLESQEFLSEETFEEKFGGTDWKHLPDLVYLPGPLSSDGEGYEIFYSPSTGRVFQTCGYW